MGIGTFLCDKSFASNPRYLQKSGLRKSSTLCRWMSQFGNEYMVRNNHGRWLRLVKKVMEKKRSEGERKLTNK